MKKSAPQAWILFLTVAGTAVGLFIGWRQFQPEFQIFRQHARNLNPPELENPHAIDAKFSLAFDRYLRDHSSPGQPLPESVSLQDLCTNGYLTSEDLQRLDITGLTYYPNANIHNPTSILATVRMRDGKQTVILANGSIRHSP